MSATAVAPSPASFTDDMEQLFEVENLEVYFPVREGIIFEKTIGHVKAVDGVSFDIRRGVKPWGWSASPGVARPRLAALF